MTGGPRGFLAEARRDSGEGCPLVFPEQRQVGTLQPLAGQLDRRGAVENRLDPVGGFADLLKKGDEPPDPEPDDPDEDYPDLPAEIA